MSLPENTPPGFRVTLKVWARIGLLSFGGPAAQIALMHRVLVEERRWLDERTFLNALGFCMLLPGPEAMQLATYAGWRMHGVRGGLVAGGLFILPGALVVLVLAWIYMLWGMLPVAAALFLGIKAAVLAIVLDALRKIARRTLHDRSDWALAGLSFIAIFCFDISFFVILGAGALYGLIFRSDARDEPTPITPRPGAMKKTLGTVTGWMALWLGPLACLGWLGGEWAFLGRLGWYFAQLAVVSFGGAYAVLGYMAQGAASGYGWVNASQMMDGLGLAESTPGPLILVTEFVGYVAAWQHGGLMLGLGGALVALWATFVPCFLWIFAGAPYIEWIGALPRLRSALHAITAVVVGVILNLALWFGLHVLFRDVTRQSLGPVHIWLPELPSLDPVAALCAGLSLLLVMKYNMGIGWVLVLCALSGLAGQFWLIG